MTEISVLSTLAVRVGSRALAASSQGSRQRQLTSSVVRDHAAEGVAFAAGFWPHPSLHVAGITLRVVLSRMKTVIPGENQRIAAGERRPDTAAIDHREGVAVAQRLLQCGSAPRELDLSVAAVRALSVDSAPDLSDDGAVIEAERWRLLRVNALEAQARLLTARGRLAEAAVAAGAATKAEPMRESAYVSLVRIHMAAGNSSEALKVFDRYRRLLLGELGLEPTALLVDLVAGIGPL